MAGHGPLQLVGVGDGLAVGDGVAGEAQPLAVQASQQLAQLPTHAAPPGGALQWLASRLIRHRVTPAEVLTQHDIAPGLPQIDRVAQRSTNPLQRGFNCPFSIRVRRTPDEQRV